MRLFESSFFNMDMALQYLFNSKDSKEKSYLAQRLFGFPTEEVDFYLLQLVSLYKQSTELAEYLYPYFIYRCTQSTEFALHLVWLLDTFNPPQRDPSGRTTLALSRPSSVPSFSYSAANTLSLFTVLQQQQQQYPTCTPPVISRELLSSVGDHFQSVNGIATPETTDGNQQNKPEYTIEALRTTLFPTQEDSLVFLALAADSLAGSPPFPSLQSVSVRRAASGAAGDLQRYKKSVESTDQPTTCSDNNVHSRLPPLHPSGSFDFQRSMEQHSHMLGHKRAVSDLTCLTTQQNLRNYRFRRLDALQQDTSCHQSVRENHWSSQDSAVGLSQDTTNQSPHTTSHRRISHSKNQEENSHEYNSGYEVAVTQGADATHFFEELTLDEGRKAVGSTSSVNKIITKEIVMTPQFEACLRSARSLQWLGSPDPVCPPSSFASHFSLDLPGTVKDKEDTPSSDPPHQTTLSPNQASCTTASSSPPDSGLHLVIPGSSQSTADEGKSRNLSALDPIFSLQLQLVPRLVPQWDFVDGLLRLSRRLMPINSKEQRTAYLQAELANLNLHLPARVWIPVNKADHIVLRIPPTAAVCLNSKEKAPFLIYLEILYCKDPWSVPLPSRPSGTSVKAISGSSSLAGGAVSLSSLLTCPWNSTSGTPSSTGDQAAAADALSLVSDESASSLEDPDIHSQLRTSSSAAVTVTENDIKTQPTRLQLHDGTTVLETDADSSEIAAPISPVFIAAGAIRNRLKEQSEHQPLRSFKSDPEDPSAAVLKEPWQVKCQRIRELSPWGSLPGWGLTAAIVKVGDDLRQEQLAYQLLSVLQRIWETEHVNLWLRPLTVIVTSPDSGLIEPVPDTVSLHQIRRHAQLSLLDYLIREHGTPTSEEFLTCQGNFIRSCAAYCLVGYLLQVKDRHNGNILLDSEGHVIHIDYGFILSASPGRNIGFETSPFKLTTEQVAVMGGVGSDMFNLFKYLLLSGLLAARKHMEEICVLVEIARATCPQLPCFAHGGGTTAIKGLRQRFMLSRTEKQIEQMVDNMVHASLHSVTTKLYDSFQYYTNGIQ
ncbi:unnamed protein product [Calicophoron daubneyi]|uniref:Phosphatidylinositol 4-kinase beta n=1 Tax=Calicophoron daubneyi TaxID=300641 RepID=A0AAV2T116_CALDB